jgi:hypothetical protein
MKTTITPKTAVLLACMPALITACLNLPNPIDDLKLEVSDVSYTTSSVSAKASINRSSGASEWGIALFGSNDVEIKRATSYQETFSYTFVVDNPQSCALKAYAIFNSAVTIFGEAYYVDSAPVTPGVNSDAPMVLTGSVGNLTSSSFEVALTVSALGSSGYVSDAGVIISSSTTTPTTDNGYERKQSAGAKYSTGGSTVTFTGLNASTKYYVRAYATNSYGTAYGATLQATTLASSATGSTASVSVSDFMSISNGIYMWFKPSSNTVKYYWRRYLSNELAGMTDAQTVADVRENGIEYDVASDGNEGYAWSLTASTSYTICVVAYDAAGNAGQLQKTAIITKSTSSNQPLATVNVSRVTGGTAYYTVTQNSYCSKYVAAIWYDLTPGDETTPDIYWAGDLYEKRNDADWYRTANVTNGSYTPSLPGLCCYAILAFNSSGVNGGAISRKFFNTSTGTIYATAASATASSAKAMSMQPAGNEKYMAKKKAKTVDYVTRKELTKQ